MPLAVWMSRVTDIDVLKSVMDTDVGLTHSNQDVKDAVVIYASAIGALLRGASAGEAFERAEKVAHHLKN